MTLTIDVGQLAIKVAKGIGMLGLAGIGAVALYVFIIWLIAVALGVGND